MPILHFWEIFEVFSFGDFLPTTISLILEAYYLDILHGGFSLPFFNICVLYPSHYA